MANISIPQFYIISMSFRSAPIAERERMAAHTQEVNSLLSQMKSSGELDEGAAICTCNRFEVICVNPCSLDEVAVRMHALSPVVSEGAWQRFHGEAAVAHLFRVTAGLDSMVVGEPQITGQVKDAYSAAVARSQVGKYLHHLFQSAFRVAKRIRSATSVAERGISLSYIAVQLAERLFESLHKRTVLVIGSGHMAELTAMHFFARHQPTLRIANRTVARAEELASRVNGSSHALSELTPLLGEADIVVGSVSASAAVIQTSQIKQLKRETPLLLIDLGVPRNFPPTLAALHHVHLYNIDDLTGIAEQNNRLRHEAAGDAEVAIEHGVYHFFRWLHRVAREPGLLSFRDTISHTCESELRQALQTLIDTPAIDELSSNLSKRITQRVMHEVSVRLASQDPTLASTLASILPIETDT